MARRAQGGTLLYPFAVALLGVGSRREGTFPVVFLALLALVTLLAFFRLFLIRRFDEVYGRDPRRWAIAFFGGALATCAIFSGLLYFRVHDSGLTPYTLFAVVASIGISAMAIVLYAPSLSVTWSYILLLGVPLVIALAQAGDGWISLCIAIAVVYLLGVARQQHHERWEALAMRHQLSVRAADLERAQVDLQHTRESLERLVEERTRALEQTSQDYRQIFESAHDAIIVFRPEDERVLNVNRRACEVYGFTREEFLEISLASVSENVARGQQQIRETLEWGTYYNFESTQFRKDGSRMFLEINASKMIYEGELAIISINRDVTERRRAEALRLAKEAAERTARAKAQFLANMSHEVRTPMAGVVGLADLLLTTELDGQQGQYARLIQSSTVSLLRVIDDILDFSKIEAGKLSFETVPFDLRATLRDVTELLRLAALGKGTALDLEVEESVPTWVFGDPGRLRQVLMNLTGNAVKFTEGGGVSVHAGMSGTGAAAKVHIRIRDSGIGIPAEAQGGLFELFSQADGSTSRRFGGTGLGLAISKRIVESMGGEIGFESAPGTGSLFWILVPLEPTVAPARPEAPVGRPGVSRRILAAEDNPINQLVITEHLKSLGYEVTPVANGLEALEEIQARAYDLVLMDCQMPHLDGYETTQRIRQLPGVVGRIPIIALTAHAIREDLDKCLAVGMNDTITKPFRGETLLRKLEHWLGSDAESQAGPGPQNEPADGTLDERQVEFLNSLREESDPDILNKLIGHFRRQSYVEELRGALDRGDRIAVQGCAHKLKGSSSLLGATRLPRLCAQLEMASQKGLKEECLRQLALIEIEHRKVLHALDAMIEPS